MPTVSENLLYELERHLNNYFNPTNDPNNPARDYPPAFLELAGEIEKYKNSIDRDNITHEANASYNVSTDLNYNSWQKAFSRELSIYKRVKFI